MFKKNNCSGVVYYTSDIFDGRVIHGFSTRRGGVSKGIYSSMNFRLNSDDAPENIKENFRIFTEAVGAGGKRPVISHQVHEDVIKYVTESDMGNGIDRENKFASADGLITDRRGVPIMIFYADCVPVLLYDGKAGVAAAVHSGWRGTVARISEKAVKMMTDDFGCNANDIKAAVGPCIGSCCYEVGSEVAERFEAEFGGGCVDERGGRLYADMNRAIAMQLESSGITRQNMDISGICTCCGHNELFSHRATNGRRGVMGALIMLK